MKDTLNIRLKFKGHSITAIPGDESDQAQLRADIKDLGQEWITHLAMGLRDGSVEEANVEFVLQSTLDYIDSLEGVLERLQADTDTPDALLAEIEKVLQ